MYITMQSHEERQAWARLNMRAVKEGRASWLMPACRDVSVLDVLYPLFD